jgi:acid phosphatase (class A)
METSFYAKIKFSAVPEDRANDASFFRWMRHTGINKIRMKRYIIVAVLIVSWSVSIAQKPKSRELSPVKGYYRSLQSFSAQPKSPDEAVDREKFPYDASAAEKRLSMKPYYLKGVTLDDFQIPDPPANSSEQTRAELNYLLQLQQTRTKLDVESSLHMAGIYYSVKTKPGDSLYNQYRQNLFHIGRSLGNWFNPTDLPVTADFMARVWQDASYFIWAAKYKYLRVRPYVLDKDIQNLEETNWAAYPSGHAANSYVNAYIYQEVAPEFSEVFIKDAYDMAHSREILGVHYPSDSESSRVLARQFVNKLFQNEKFVQDFELVRKEWREKAKESFVKPAINQSENSKSSTSCGSKSTESACAKTCH